VYTFLDHRLVDWAGSDTISGLPSVLKTPLSQPLFVLGLLFILLVLFLPGGIAGLASLSPRRRGLALLEQRVAATPHEAVEEETEPAL
jgi:branched-chain amino acid transport system permease protein